MRLSLVIKRIEQKERKVKLVLLGLDNAGKTTLLSAFAGTSIDDIPPTFGYQVVHQELNYQGVNYQLAILDIGGQASIRSYWDTYYAGADGVLFVYDTCSDNRYQPILESLVSHPTLRHAAIICAANKADAIRADTAAPPKEISVRRYTIEEEVPFDFVQAIERLKLSQPFVETTIPIYYTSAKTGLNVKKVFTELLAQILRDRKKNGIL